MEKQEDSYKKLTLFLGLAPADYDIKFAKILCSSSLEDVTNLLLQVCSPMKVHIEHLGIGRATLASFADIALPKITHTLKGYTRGEIMGEDQIVTYAQLFNYWKTGTLILDSIPTEVIG